MGWDGWREHWGEGGHDSIILDERGLYFGWAEYYYGGDWTIITIGPDVAYDADVDEGFLDIQQFCPGLAAAVALRQCAGEN